MIKRLAAAAVAGGLLFAAAGASTASAADRPSRPSRPSATDDAPRPDRPNNSNRRYEQIRLACRPASNGDERGIGCRWTASQSPRFASYRLVRGTQDGREVVFRTEDKAHTHYLDTDVERGVRYRYVVMVFDKHDKLIGRSNVVTVGIPAAE